MIKKAIPPHFKLLLFYIPKKKKEKKLSSENGVTCTDWIKSSGQESCSQKKKHYYRTN